MSQIMAPKKGFLERLAEGEYVICAEGYLFEFERRGYLRAGHFAPEVVLEHPHLVKSMHEEFVHSGSDVVQAFTYYGHRQKLKVAGREDDVEKLNKQALRIAKEVGDQTGTLLAGNICNTTVYTPGDKQSESLCEKMFKEQLEWAVEAKSDLIIAETFMYFGEAQLALKCIKEYAPGIPCVLNLAPGSDDKTFDGFDFPSSLQKLQEMGADVVGLNCFRGPDSIIPLMKEIKQKCKGPLACLPVPYRTTMEEKCMQNLKDQKTGRQSFPVNLDSWLCSRDHIQEFTESMQEMGIKFIGVCCGNRAGYIRTMAETLGRQPPTSKYSPDMTQHMSRIKGKDFEDNVQSWHKSLGTEAPK